MLMLIDCSDPQVIAIGVDLAGGPWEWHQQKMPASNDLLRVVSDCLSAQPFAERNRLVGIGVLFGQGGFTAARRAAVVANTLALALKARAKALEERISPLSLAERLKAAPEAKYVLPRYSGAPRIGLV